jgi:hypothetical protein
VNLGDPDTLNPVVGSQSTVGYDDVLAIDVRDPSTIVLAAR